MKLSEIRVHDLNEKMIRAINYWLKTGGYWQPSHFELRMGKNGPYLSGVVVGWRQKIGQADIEFASKLYKGPTPSLTGLTPNQFRDMT